MENQEDTKEKEEEEENEKEKIEPVAVTEEWKTLKCLHCTRQLTSPAHVMLECGHLFHIQCFVMRSFSLLCTTCSCEQTQQDHPSNWGRDKTTTDLSLPHNKNNSECQPNNQTQKIAEEEKKEEDSEDSSTSILANVKYSLLSFLGSAAANRISKEDHSKLRVSSLSTQQLQKLISNGTLSIMDLEDQQCSFSNLVSRGITMDNFLKGGASLLELKEHLFAKQLNQLIEAGLSFKHLKIYRSQTSPDQLAAFPDARPATFQKFQVTADAFLTLKYSAIALQTLGLTAPNLCCWPEKRALTAHGILKSPYDYRDWSECLELTPELAVRVGLRREMLPPSWPSTAVADRHTEPLRVVNDPSALYSYKQPRRKPPQDPYRGKSFPFAQTRLQY